MSLSKKQRAFTRAIGKLIQYAYAIDVELTFGDAYATTGHMKNSNHYRRLAVDFNLFVGGMYIQSGEHPAWEKLHTYFESIGGAPMIKHDANHFSLEYHGII